MQTLKFSLYFLTYISIFWRERKKTIDIHLALALTFVNSYLLVTLFPRNSGGIDT